MPVARHSSSRLPASGARRSATIDARSPLGRAAGAALEAVSGRISLSGVSGAVRTGSLFGSSRSGSVTVGRVAFAAERKGSGTVPALTGAIIVAVNAATISNAERKEAKIHSILCGKSTVNAYALFNRYFWL